MRVLILILIFIASLANAGEIIVLAEITPPYADTDKNSVVGIYKDILDHAFMNSQHTYELKLLNARSLVYHLEKEGLYSVIGISKYHSHFSKLKKSNSIGSISINPITKNKIELSLPYTVSLATKTVGAVQSVGFDKLFPYIKFKTYTYAQQGALKLLNNELDVIIEDPLIIACTSNALISLASPNNILDIHSPSLANINLYFGITENNKNYYEIINLINKGIQTVNINTLSKKYLKNCIDKGGLILNEARQSLR
jgi:hypothetical protein